MPLFSRSSFRTPKKPPRRKAESLPNISHLEDSILSADSMRLEHTEMEGRQPSIAMKLGDHEVSFEEGQWLVSGSQGVLGSRDYVRIQKQNLKLLEENNLLKYKVELLLDMLAASNADCLVLQRELEAVRKVQSQTPRKR